MRIYHVFFSVLVLLFFSCSGDIADEELLGSSTIKDVFTGMAFEDWEEFKEVYQDLSNSNSENHILDWIAENGHSSLFLKAMNTNDPDFEIIMNQLTPAFLAILNDDHKFKVGADIIYFQDQIFYAVPEEHNTDGLINIQDSQFEEIGSISTNTVAIVSDKGDVIGKSDKFDDPELYSELVLGVSSAGAGQEWHDFKRNAYYECGTNKKIYGPSKRNMRYFHQLTTKSTTISPIGAVSEIYIQFKLFWRNSRNKLRYAETEQMNYTIKLNGRIGFRNFIYSQPQYEFLNLNKTISCIRFPKWYDYKLHFTNWIPAGNGPSWHLDATGTITHSINGDDFSNRWVAQVDW